MDDIQILVLHSRGVYNFMVWFDGIALFHISVIMHSFQKIALRVSRTNDYSFKSGTSGVLDAVYAGHSIKDRKTSGTWVVPQSFTLLRDLRTTDSFYQFTKFPPIQGDFYIQVNLNVYIAWIGDTLFWIKNVRVHPWPFFVKIWDRCPRKSTTPSVSTTVATVTAMLVKLHSPEPERNRP